MQMHESQHSTQSGQVRVPVKGRYRLLGSFGHITTRTYQLTMSILILLVAGTTRVI